MSEGEKGVKVVLRSSSDVEELREVLSALSGFIKELPGLIRDVLEVLYDKDLARKAAESFATFYTTLKEQGFSEEVALEMAKKFYEDSLSLRSIVGTALERARRGEAKRRAGGE